MGKDPVGTFVHHQEIYFSCLEWLFFKLRLSVFIWNNHTFNWHKWSYSRKAKTAAEHLILGSFTTSLKLEGLTCSPFLILTYLLCFPGTKKMTFIWKQHFFPVFYNLIFMFFSRYNIFFFFWARCYFFNCFVALRQAVLNLFSTTPPYVIPFVSRPLTLKKL